MTTTQQQFNWMVRSIEDGYEGRKNSEAYRVFDNILRNAPLYLWSEEKAQAALNNHEPIDLLKITNLIPCTTVDRLSAVILMDCIPIAQGLFQISGMISAYTTEAKNHSSIDGTISWAVGALQIDPHHDADRKYLSRIVRKQYGVVLVKGKKLTPVTKEHLPEQMDRAIDNDLSHGIITACQQLWYTFKPKVIVVKESSSSGKKKQNKTGKKARKIPRAGDRDTHIILDPDQINIIKKQSEDAKKGRAPVRPHVRRAHVRVLRSPRFTAARGKVISIGETEINVKPGEVITHPRRVYHVVSVGGRGSSHSET